MSITKRGKAEPIGAPTGSTSLVFSKNFIGNFGFNTSSYTIDLPIGAHIIYASNYWAQDADTLITVKDSSSNEYAAIRTTSTTSEISGVFYLSAATTLTVQYQTVDSGFIAGQSVSASPVKAYTYGNGLYVAVGGNTGASQSSGIYSSTDGITWTTRTGTFGSTTIYSIAYGNGVFVAVGDAGQIRTSTDAITWTTRTSNFGTTTIRSVVFNPDASQFLAAGDSKQVRLSTDGITWTTSGTATVLSNIYTAIYGNGKYVVGDDGAKIAYSTDGITWTTATSAFTSTADIFCGVYANNTYVLAGGAPASSELASSTDGITWTTRTLNLANKPFSGISYVSGGYVISSANANQMAISTDLVTWTTSSIATTISGNQFYREGMLLVGGSLIHLNRDGATNVQIYKTDATSVAWFGHV